MAKISPASVKYMIHASFRLEGPLEKPDVIGAIFGQTEGLLGDELEMRELQKEGKIGRIEVNLETIDGKSIGEIQIPSALDKSETTLLAASLETIDKIGPMEAEIKISSIKDVRADKRDYILQRAKSLLGTLEGSSSIGEFSKSLKEDSRAEKIQEYGTEKLPSGNLSGNEIIVVEGRADVVNLLRNRVSNVIGMNGTKLPAEIARLGKEKELTLFVDGDRGGKLIAGNVISNAKITYVAVAPSGKEVEELESKEILMALRKKAPVNEYVWKEKITLTESKSNNGSALPDYNGDIKEKVREVYAGIKGEKNALILDGSMDVIRKVGLRDLPREVKNSRKQVYVVILEGTATIPIIRACEERGIKYLAATNFSSVKESNVELISL